ncbi:MAG: Ig-like domain-containing protein [Bacteroidia bacterium]
MAPSRAAAPRPLSAIAFISVLVSGGPLDSATVNTQSVRPHPSGRPEQAVPSFVLYREDLRNITLEPYGLLLPKTSYTFEISSAVTDTFGNAFKPYIATFSTGDKALKNDYHGPQPDFGNPPGVIDEDPDPGWDAMIAEAEAEWAKKQEERKQNLPAISMVRVPSVKNSMPSQPSKPITVNPLNVTPVQLEPGSVVDVESIVLRKIEFRPDAFWLENDLRPQYVAIIDQVELLDATLDTSLLNALMMAMSADELPSDEDLAMGIKPGEQETTVITPGLSAAGQVLFENGSNVRLGQYLEITFDFDEDEYVTMKLRTYGGEVMLTEKGWVYPGRRKRLVKINGIPPGTYYAVFESESFKTTRKVVVTR